MSAASPGAVVFVTWLDEGVGHYSLLIGIEGYHITLMDPWTARDGQDNRMRISEFTELWRAGGRGGSGSVPEARPIG